MKMSEIEQPSPVPPSPSQIAHAPRGSAPRSVRRLEAKAVQKTQTRRVRKARARIRREFVRAGMPMERTG